MEREPIIHIENVHKWFGHVHALRGVNLDVYERGGGGHYWAFGVGQVHPTTVHQPFGRIR